MHLKPHRPTKQRLHLYILHFLQVLFRYHCVYVAELLQTTQRPNGNWSSPSGVIPAHVHCFAWVDVLGSISAEILWRAVTDADRRDLPLALLLFRQVFNTKKTTPAPFGRSQVPPKSEGKNITMRIIPEKGGALDDCKIELVLGSSMLILVGWFWCLPALYLSVHTRGKQTTVNSTCWCLINHGDTFNLLTTLLSE